MPSFCRLQYEKRGKAWMDLSHDACRCWCHVQSAHIWACSLPFTLLSLNSVRCFCSVCPASPIATGSIIASYSTWHQQRHASPDKSFQAFPPLFMLQATKAGHGGLGTRLIESAVWGHHICKRYDPYCLWGPSTYTQRQKRWPFCCVSLGVGLPRLFVRRLVIQGSFVLSS